MAKKTKPRKTKTVSGTAGDGAAKKRGRQPNKWIEGFGPGNLVEYRKKFALSEAKLAAYLSTTLTSYRNWVGGQSTPSEAKQKELRELLGRDYVAPPEGEKNPRGRPRKAAAEMTTSIAAARSSVSSNGDGHPVSSSSLGDVVAAYVRRLPADRSLSMEDLEAITAHIRRILSK